MTGAEFDIDVLVGDGARAVAGIVTDVFAGAGFDVFRDARVTEPVDGGSHDRVGFIVKAIVLEALNGTVKTVLHDFSDVTRA